MARRLVVVVIMAGLLVGGVAVATLVGSHGSGGAPRSPAVTGALDSPLAGRSFRILRIVRDGRDYPIFGRTNPTLRFFEAAFNETTGCNAMRGKYSIEETGLLTLE